MKDLSSAIDDFRSARNRAMIREVAASLRGQPTQLLSFEEVRKQLRAKGTAARGLEDIPLDAIVGSVGRYVDFTRDFLPRETVDEQRWARIRMAASSMAGLPPIEVYKIGEVYFVKDGNHRVSVARQLGAKYIQAYVTEIRTRVPLTPDVKPDDLIIKAEYAEFLEQTRLDELRPDADLTLTAPGGYQDLLEHISVHRYFMGIEQNREIPYTEAVVHWYDTVYLPVVDVIREQGILRFFPNRTETDLYLWVTDHRAVLEEEFGLDISTAEAASDLVDQYSPQPKQFVNRLSGKLRSAVLLDKLEEGPPPGQWRKERQRFHRRDRLFNEILVPITGRPDSWTVLDQALMIARREEGRLHGLHVIQNEDEWDEEMAEAQRAEFNLRCAQAGIAGEIRFAAGEISRQICNRSRWMDLITVSLNYPPPPQPIARLSSGFREIIQRCPTPVFAIPRATSPLKRGLLAYDSSPKAQEALYISTYLAGQWQIELVVLCNYQDGEVSADTFDHARSYLESYGVSALYVEEDGPYAATILQTAEAQRCDFLIMGGYGESPVKEVVLGSGVDQVLRGSSLPALICR